jgi:hypothetical protein
MSILQDIQAALLSENSDLATTLLKLRFLASRLGSEALEEWVKHEAEGYPAGVDLPSYRVVGVQYTGTWSGAFNSGISNAPIPPQAIAKFAGKQWLRYNVRESIGGVEELSKGKEISIDASHLMLKLQDNVYPDMACNAVEGHVSIVAIREIKQKVRSRILEFTIELEKRVPEAASVTIQAPIEVGPSTPQAVTQIFNQTINGNVTNVSATGNASVNLAVIAGDVGSLASELTKAGLPEPAAREFAEIVAAEQPKSVDKPLGKKALAWMKTNVPKVAGGAWEVGSSVATTILTEAALRYWNLKG